MVLFALVLRLLLSGTALASVLLDPVALTVGSQTPVPTPGTQVVEDKPDTLAACKVPLTPGSKQNLGESQDAITKWLGDYAAQREELEQKCIDEGSGSCPGSGTAHFMQLAWGFGKETYETGKALVNGAMHPIDTATSAARLGGEAATAIGGFAQDLRKDPGQTLSNAWNGTVTQGTAALNGACQIINDRNPEVAGRLASQIATSVVPGGAVATAAKTTTKLAEAEKIGSTAAERLAESAAAAGKLFPEEVVASGDRLLSKEGVTSKLAGAAQMDLKGNTVLWAGGQEAQAAAQNFALNSGRTTLEQSAAGQALVQATKGKPWAEAEPQWIAGSKDYASGATGTVHVFLNGEAGIRSGAILLDHEMPIVAQLAKQEKVTGIQYHIIKGGKEVQLINRPLALVQ
jgi:hypothetical protein